MHTGKTADLRDFRAVLFDLDGVLTPTAQVHQRAWSRLFTEYFASLGNLQHYAEDDYFRYLDGKPRYEGVRSLLEAKGIHLPLGEPSDSENEATVCGLGNRKNTLFRNILHAEGVEVYPGSLSLLDWLANTAISIAVVSSSKNAAEVLAAAGIEERFEYVVDGRVAENKGIPGKPAPDTFLYAAELLGVAPEDTVVIEDAVSGVTAAAAGGFFTIAVDRGAGGAALEEAGADLVTADLAELIPDPAALTAETSPAESPTAPGTVENPATANSAATPARPSAAHQEDKQP